MSYESWKKENEGVGIISEPTGFEAWKQESVDSGLVPDTAKLSREAVDLTYDKYRSAMQTIGEPGTTQVMTRDTFDKSGQAQEWVKMGLAKTPRSHFEKLAEATKRGLESFRTQQNYFRAAMLGEGEPEALFGEWKKQQATDQLDPLEGSFLAEMEYGTARILPGMIEGARQSLPLIYAGGAIGAVAGAGAGAPVLGVGAVPGAAVGAAGGLATGFKVGSTYAWYQQGAGEMLLNMRDKGFDEGASKIIASIAALPYALIEQMQIGQLTPGLRQGASKVIQKSVTKLMGQVAKKYGKTLTQEVLEEVAQEGVMIIAEDLSQYFSDQGIPVTKAELQARAFRLWKTMTESAKAMALLPVGGAVVDMQVGNRALKALDVEEVTEEEKKTVFERAYIKGFVAKIQTIKNNADNIVAKAGNKRKQLKVMTSELSSLQESYVEISDTIDENPDALPELAGIREILPKYAEAVDAFKAESSQENFQVIKDVTSEVTELQQKFGERIGEQAVPAAEAVEAGQGWGANHREDRYDPGRRRQLRSLDRFG